MKDSKTDTLEVLHLDMAAANMAPTWVHVSEFVSSQPDTSYRPWLWRWSDIKPLLDRAGELLTPERGSERRSMEHVNPDLPKQFATTHTMATAMQLVKAGESAPAHRHAASAIRFAAFSQGGDVFTRVDGEPLHMEPYDLVLTPANSWHEHENNSESDIVWLDALDFPLVNLMQASYFEPGGKDAAEPREKDFTSRRMGPMRPVGWGDYPVETPTVRYPWSEMDTALEAEASEAGSPFDGTILEYVNPQNGGPTLPNMSCRAQRIKSSQDLTAHRDTSSTIYFVIDGEGETVINGTVFQWQPGDVFLIPIWAWHEHKSVSASATLFSITDQPAIEKLGLFRSEVLDTKHQDRKSVFEGSKR